MTSMWDKSKLQEEFPQCQTLKQVISSIEGSFSGRGEVICEIRVNGMLLDASISQLIKQIKVIYA